MVVFKCQLQAKFPGWVWGNCQLNFGWWLFHMKRETNDSELNHLLSLFFMLYCTYCRSGKIWIKNIISDYLKFCSSMWSKPIQTKRCFEWFTVFSFCFSFRHNFVFTRLGSLACDTLPKIGNEIVIAVWAHLTFQLASIFLSYNHRYSVPCKMYLKNTG